METDQKNKLQLLMIFGSICLSIMYVNNTTIDGTSFQEDVVHRFIPFVANYNPVTVGLVFVIVCFVLAFLISDRSIPKQNNSENQSSDVKPIIQPIIIKPIVAQPRNSSGHTIEQAETRIGHIWTQNTYHSFKPKKKRLVIRNYYDRRNRKRFGW